MASTMLAVPGSIGFPADARLVRVCSRLMSVTTAALAALGLAATGLGATGLAHSGSDAEALEVGASRPQAGSHASGADRERFEALIIPHLDAAYNLARFLSRDGHAAEDIVQDAFLRAFRSFDTFRGEDSRAWILTIVRNCYRTWSSERRREPVAAHPPDRTASADGATDPSGLDEIEDPDQETPEAALLRRSEAAAVRLLLENLPEPLREILVLREFEDLSYRQIAAITATPIGTVMSRLARARDTFGKAWRRLVDGEEDPA